MRTPEFGPVDPVTARSINQIERTRTVCERCGYRGGYLITVYYFNGNRPEIMHLEHLNEDRKGRA